MGIPSNRTIARVSALLAAVSLVAACVAAAWMFGNKGEAIRNAELTLAREAGIVGERLDGIFRTTTVVLGGISREPENIAELALSVPEAANYLFVDDQDRVRASFYRRPTSPSISSRTLQRLKGGSRFEAGEAFIASEGARSLILAQRIDSVDGSYGGAALAVFSERLLDDALASLLGTAVESLYLTDDADAVILFRSRTKTTLSETAEASYLPGTYQLRSLPLRVHLLAPRDAALASRYHLSWLVIGVSLAFALVFGAMSWYAFFVIRGENRADELALELKHRESLFREVSHRVKNDLQIVRGVLNLGTECVDMDGARAREVLLAAESRIRSISLVHEQLYKRAALATIDLGSYMEDLALYLEESYGADRPVSVVANVESNLSVSMDAAVPCGLLLNELVTNAFKYAFPEGRAGTVALGASRRQDGGIDLSVGDDGVGFEEDSDGAACGFGLEMVKSLTDQLRAKIRREGGPGSGTRWIVSLPPEPRECAEA